MSGGDLVTRGGADATTLGLVRTLEELGLLDDVSFRPGGLDGGLREEQALGLGGLFGRFARAVPWWIGDLLLYCKRQWGEGVVGQIEAVTGLHPETLADYERMAELIPPEDRIPGLSFRHHRAVKTLDSCERRDWLRRSVDEEWSSDDLRREIAAEHPSRTRPPRRRPRSDEQPSILSAAQDSPPVQTPRSVVDCVRLRRLALSILLRAERGDVVDDEVTLQRLRLALARDT